MAAVRELDGPVAPPASIESEQSVLGALLLDPASLVQVSDFLRPEDFWRRDHGAIYQAVIDLAASGKPTDPLTLADFLADAGLGESTGGMAYLAELASTTPSAANIVAYAEIVLENSRRRQAMDVANRLLTRITAPRGQRLADIAGEAARELTALEPTRQAGLVQAKPVLRELWNELQARYASGVLPGLETPWEELNRVTGGLQDGEVIVLGARSNMGKTAKALQIAAHAAKAGQRTAVFSLEQTRKAVMRRILSAEGSVPHEWLRRPDDRPEYWAMVTEATRRLTPAELFIDDSPRLSAFQIGVRARREHMRKGLRLVVIDHLHEFQLPGKQNEAQERGDALRDIRALAKDLNCPVVVLAQLNRESAKDGGKTEQRRPNLTDLRGSGGIEEVADLVLLLHRPEYYRKGVMPGVAELIVAKGRDIQTGVTIYLRSELAFMRFVDWKGELPMSEDDEPPARAAPRGYRAGTTPIDHRSRGAGA